MHVDPGNRFFLLCLEAVIGDLCLPAPPVYFVLPLLRGDLQITSVGMKDKTGEEFHGSRVGCQGDGRLTQFVS